MKKTLISGLFALATIALQAQNGTTYYVSQDGSGTGTSWANAGDLESTATAAVAGDEIWVKAGTYNPVETVTLPEDVKMYGGFAGTETDPTERDISKNLTTIDGSSHIGSSVILLNKLCVLDGFIVQGGNRTGQNQNGGGVYANGDAVIENCIIRNNFAYNGGGVYGKGHVKIINSEVNGNKAASLGYNTYGHCFSISLDPSAPVVSGPVGPACPPCSDNSNPDTIGDYCKPVIIIQPSDSIRFHEFGEPFSTLFVAANSASSLSYQWYSMTNVNGPATPISGETEAFFTPSSFQYGTMLYYCVVSNECGEVKSNIGGIHITSACIPPRFSTQPSAQPEEVTQGVGTFPLLSASAIGTLVQYQWFSNTVNSNTGGTLVSTDFDSYQPSNTIPIGTPMFYYCVAANMCGSDTSDVSGVHTTVSACTPPSIIANPNAMDQSREVNGKSFNPLSVTVSGTLPLTYQWYSNSMDNTNDGIPVGANSLSYTPSNTTVSELWYYCVVSNTCGMDTSNVSGKHSVTVPPTAPNCNGNTPGFGSSLGTITFASAERTISGYGIVQTWSGAVSASKCSNRTSFAGGSSGNYNADCRSNPNQDGDLFSWCAVVRFGNQLCPAPWRVPTKDDFIKLDIALGGNGVNRPYATTAFLSKYTGTGSNQWGGSYGGHCNGTGALYYQNLTALYWSQTEYNSTLGYDLAFGTTGCISPQIQNNANYGLTLRCVK